MRSILPTNRAASRRARRQASHCRAHPPLESLEPRLLLSLAFTPQYPGQTTTNGGNVDTGNVPVYLIFAGGSTTGFGYDGSLNTTQLQTAVNQILASPFLTGLAEYGATATASVQATYLSTFNLPTSFSTGDLQNCVEDALNDGNGTLPEVDDTSVDGIYFVLTPKGVTSSDNPQFVGYHTYGGTGTPVIDPDNAAFGWVSSAGVTDNNRNLKLSPIDSFSSLFSHELAETLSDPDTTSGVTTVPPSNAPYFQSPGEVCDDEAQLYHGYEGGVSVQSIWSAAQGKFIIPGATLQPFAVTGTTLTIVGDQYGNGKVNDAFSIDPTGSGFSVTLNGETVTYTTGQITHIDIKLLTGTNTINLNTLPTGVTINIDGSPGITNLIAPNTANTWDITSTGGGTLNTVVTFSHLNNITGGSNVDNFDFFSGGFITGTVDGAGGTNTSDDSALSTQVFVDLQNNQTTNMFSFTRIGSFIGSSDPHSYVNGTFAPSTWIIWSTDDFFVGSESFSAFDNIYGGANADTFSFSSGGSLSGTVDGSSGTNTLDYSHIAGPVTVNFQTSQATFLGGFLHINNVIGSQSSNDTLIGPDASWIISGFNSGSVNSITFSSMENLTGAPGDDTFAFKPGGSISGNLDGGAPPGTNTLDYSALSTNVTVNLATHTATGIGGTFSNINGFTGGSGTNTVVGPNTPTTYTITGHNIVTFGGSTFSNFQSITGGSANDLFAFQTTGLLDGAIDGGGGVNTLSYAAFTGTVFVDLPLGTATAITKGITHIQNLTGSIGNSLLVGDANANTLLAGTGRAILIGGLGADTLSAPGGPAILIGSATKYDSNPTALLALFAEWSRTDEDFVTQTLHIYIKRTWDNGVNLPYLLNENTVLPDNAPNTLTGSAAGNDFFFFTNAGDTINSFVNPSAVIYIVPKPKPKPVIK